MSDLLNVLRHWEYKSWPLYDVCQGCGAAYASMHAVDCERPGRKDVEVVPAAQLRGAVASLEALKARLRQEVDAGRAWIHPHALPLTDEEWQGYLAGIPGFGE